MRPLSSDVCLFFLLQSKTFLSDQFLSAIDTEQTNAPWAAAGTNVTLYLTAIDPIQLNVGSVLCSPSPLVPLVTTFTARVIVFDIQVPITAGVSVSRSVECTFFFFRFTHLRVIRSSCSTTRATCLPPCQSC